MKTLLKVWVCYRYWLTFSCRHHQRQLLETMLGYRRLEVTASLTKPANPLPSLSLLSLPLLFVASTLLTVSSAANFDEHFLINNIYSNTLIFFYKMTCFCCCCCNSHCCHIVKCKKQSVLSCICKFLFVRSYLNMQAKQ